MGKLNDAKDFFLQVREATNDMPDVWLNLAHVFVAQGLHLNAIKLYQNCLKKFYFNKDTNIMLFLARAFFESQRFEECKSTLQKALHLSPHSKSLWFNLALTQEQYATGILRKDKKQQSLYEIRKAVNELKQAVVTFTRLSTLNTSAGPAVQFIAQRAEKHATYCQTSLELGRKQLQRAEELERIAQIETERKFKETEEHRLQKQKEDEERKKKEEEEEHRLEEEAKKNEEKLLGLTSKWVHEEKPEEEEEGSKKRSRRKKDKYNEDEAIEEPTVEEEDEVPQENEEERKARSLRDIKERRKKDKKKKKEKKRKHKEEGGAQSDEDKVKKKKKKRLQKFVLEPSDNPEEQKSEEKEPEEKDAEDKDAEEKAEDDEVTSPKSEEDNKDAPAEGEPKATEEDDPMKAEIDTEDKMDTDEPHDAFEVDDKDADENELDRELASLQ